MWSLVWRWFRSEGGRRDNNRVVAKDQHEVRKGEERRNKETMPQKRSRQESEVRNGLNKEVQAVGLEKKRLLRGGFVVVYRARGGWEVVLITMPRSVAIAVIQPQT